MPITDQAPFAPTPSVIKVLETYRETGLGGQITTTTLLRMGMGDEIARRVLQTLRILDWIDEVGNPTENLKAYKEASTADAKAVLKKQLYELYAPVFAVMPDPSGKSAEEAMDAFRTFKPDSLRKRMVTLFLGLCEYVGIIESSPVRKTGSAASYGRSRVTQKVAPRARGSAAGPTPAPTPRVDVTVPTSDKLDRYLDMLIKRAESADEPDPDLYDRIERALGLPARGET